MDGLRTEKFLDSLYFSYRGTDLRNSVGVYVLLHSEVAPKGFRPRLMPYAKSAKSLFERKSIHFRFVGRIKVKEKPDFFWINFPPSDTRNFYHIANLVEQSPNPIVATLDKSVFLFFEQRGVPVVHLKTKGRLVRREEFSFETQCSSLLSNSTLRSVRAIAFSMASLVDALHELVAQIGLPRMAITLQDFYFQDAVVASFFKSKCLTITLQHGIIFTDQNAPSLYLWKRLISDKMVVWGPAHMRRLAQIGVPRSNLLPLGTARYDHYLNLRQNEGRESGAKRRILIALNTNVPVVRVRQFIVELRNYLADGFELVPRIHPAVRPGERKILEDMFQTRSSREDDAIEALMRSDLLLVNESGIAIDAVALGVPVVEFSFGSPHISRHTSGDYRDFVPICYDGFSAAAQVNLILGSDATRFRMIHEQSICTSDELQPSPAGARIFQAIEQLAIHVKFSPDKRACHPN